MRSALCAAAFLLPFLTGCPDQPEWQDPHALPGEPSKLVTSVGQLQTTRKAGAPPPGEHASIELSPAAVALFEGLELGVEVYSAESLEGDGLRAQWLGEPGGEPLRAPFGGEWSTRWSAVLSLTSSPCDAAPCVLNLELVPEGDWNLGLSFPIEYDLHATLTLRGSDPPRFDYGLRLELEEHP